MFRIAYIIAVLGLFVFASIGSADVMDGVISVWNFNDGTANDLFDRNNGIVNGGGPNSLRAGFKWALT